MATLNTAEGTRTPPSQVVGSLSGVRQWESLAALVRDISNSQEQHQHLNERLWRSGHTLQQLTVQVNQGKTDLAQSIHTLRRTQEELQQQRQYFQNREGSPEVSMSLFY